MRRPAFSKGPWRSVLTLGNGAFRILCRRGYVATVESPDDARLIAKAPELYGALATIAEDVQRIAADPAVHESYRLWLAQGLVRITDLLDEVDGK